MSLRVAVIGRTRMLIDAAKRAADAGHEIALVASCRPSSHELTGEDNFRELAHLHNAPYLSHRELTSELGLTTLAAARCDIGISMNWLTLIPRAILDLMPIGLFNAHPGDLPRFRGNACPNWAIIMGERQVALTIHAMSEALDAGPVALKYLLPLTDETYIAEVYEWLGHAVPEAFDDLLSSAESGHLQLKPQPTDPAFGLRCYPRRPEDSRIDWLRPTSEILRLIRASGKPFDGAFTYLEGQRRVTVWRATLVPAREPFVAVPGQIAYAAQTDPVVAGMDGYIRLTDVEVAGCADSDHAKSVILSSLRNRLI